MAKKAVDDGGSSSRTMDLLIDELHIKAGLV